MSNITKQLVTEDWLQLTSAFDIFEEAILPTLAETPAFFPEADWKLQTTFNNENRKESQDS